MNRAVILFVVLLLGGLAILLGWVSSMEEAEKSTFTRNYRIPDVPSMDEIRRQSKLENRRDVSQDDRHTVWDELDAAFEESHKLPRPLNDESLQKHLLEYVVSDSESAEYWDELAKSSYKIFYIDARRWQKNFVDKLFEKALELFGAGYESDRYLRQTIADRSCPDIEARAGYFRSKFAVWPPGRVEELLTIVYAYYSEEAGEWLFALAKDQSRSDRQYASMLDRFEIFQSLWRKRERERLEATGGQDTPSAP